MQSISTTKALDSSPRLDNSWFNNTYTWTENFETQVGRNFEEGIWDVKYRQCDAVSRVSYLSITQFKTTSFVNQCLLVLPELMRSHLQDL